MSIKPFNYKTKVLKVIDGDTFDAVIDLGFNILLKQRIRLYGINAPESTTRNKEEKERGLKAKERLKEMIEGKEVLLQSKEWGKFGRCLGIVYIEEKGKAINDILVKEGHAIYKDY